MRKGYPHFISIFDVDVTGGQAESGEPNRKTGHQKIKF